MFYLKLGEITLAADKVRKVVRKFSNLIENNKHRRPFSDYKEGINEGLELAKDTFEENVNKFMTYDSEDARDIKIQNLQDTFNSIIDTIDVREKPNYSRDQLEGIHKGLEKSKELFEQCLKESV